MEVSGEPCAKALSIWTRKGPTAELQWSFLCLVNLHLFRWGKLVSRVLPNARTLRLRRHLRRSTICLDRRPFMNDAIKLCALFGASAKGFQFWISNRGLFGKKARSTRWNRGTKKGQISRSLWQRIVYWRMGCTWVFKGPSSGVLSNVPQKFLTALKSSGLGILKYTHRCWNKPKEENMALLYLLMVWSLFFLRWPSTTYPAIKIEGGWGWYLRILGTKSCYRENRCYPDERELPWIAVKPPPGSVNGPLRAVNGPWKFMLFFGVGFGNSGPVLGLYIRKHIPK